MYHPKELSLILAEFAPIFEPKLICTRELIFINVENQPFLPKTQKSSNFSQINGIIDIGIICVENRPHGSFTIRLESYKMYAYSMCKRMSGQR